MPIGKDRMYGLIKLQTVSFVLRLPSRQVSHTATHECCDDRFFISFSLAFYTHTHAHTREGEKGIGPPASDVKNGGFDIPICST